MDNGLDLIDMMCSCYESPEDIDEEAVQYNFSQSNNPCVHPSACPSFPAKYGLCASSWLACPFLRHPPERCLSAGTFRVAVLRKGPICVSAAVFRFAHRQALHSSHAA